VAPDGAVQVHEAERLSLVAFRTLDTITLRSRALLDANAA
jgi:hypothetical protein